MLYKTKLLVEGEDQDPSSYQEVDVYIDLSKVISIQGYVDDASVPPQHKRHSYIMFHNTKGMPLKDLPQEIVPHWQASIGNILLYSSPHTASNTPLGL